MKKITLLTFLTYCCGLFAQLTPSNEFNFDEGLQDTYSDITGVVDGATLTAGRGSEIDSAYYFDGLNDVMSFGDTLDMSDSLFTISVWVNVSEFKGPLSGTGSSGAYILVKGLSILTSPSRAGYGIKARELNGENVFEFQVGNQNNTIVTARGGDFDIDTWYHIVAVRDSSSIKLYVDNELIDEQAITATSDLNTNSSLQLALSDRFGQSPESDIYFHGLIDEVRFYNDALTLCEINTLHANNNLIVSHDMSDTLDQSYNEYNFLVDGASLTSGMNMLDSSAYYFDGEDDIISFGDVLDMSDSLFTISVWVNVSEFKGPLSGTGSSGAYILVKGLSILTSPSRAGYGIKARELNGENVFEFQVGNQNNTIVTARGGDFDIDTWYHIVAVRDSSSIKLYVDNELIDEQAITATSNLNTNSSLQFALSDRFGQSPESDIYFHGTIDQFDMYHYAMTEEQIQCDSLPTNDVLSSLSFGNYQNEVSSSFYPNPVSDVLFVHSESENFEVTISDIFGNVLIRTNSNEINIMHLTQGTYIVQKLDSNGKESSLIIKE